MKLCNICHCLIALAAMSCFFCLPAAAVQPGTVYVKTAHGGFILGYDIDQNGTAGVLAESLNAAGGTFDVAVETFDQKTGKILKIVAHQTATHNDFVALGIFGTSVGLIEFEKSKGIFVNQRLYRTINPLSANQFTGPWTPPLTTSQLILGMAASQGSPNTAVLASQDFNTFVFSSNVAANTFGPSIPLTDSVFGFNDSPVIAIDTVTNQAIVASSFGAPNSIPQIAEVDLTTGNVVEFTGLGFGFVNGVAVDSADGIACTSTEIDFSLEFYNLATHTGFKVPLHNATSQAYSGGYVQFDPVHRVFLVGQEFSSTAPSGSSIQVFDTQGHFIKAIDGLNLPASPALIALNPSQRMGYVIVTPALNELAVVSILVCARRIAKLSWRGQETGWQGCWRASAQGSRQ